MKKLFTFLAVLTFSLATFSGCILNDQFQKDPDLESHKGIIIEQSSKDGFNGTHILEMDDEEDLALRSLALNLSSSKYLDNEVEVMGFYDDEDEVFEVTGVSVLKVLSEVEDEAKFEEYANTDMGFKIRYYTDWKVVEDKDEVVFLAPSATNFEPDKVSISRYTFSYQPEIDEDGNQDTPLTAFMAENFPLVDNPEGLIRYVGPKKHEAIIMETNGSDVDYYLYRNYKIYTISFVSSEDYVAGDKKIFNEMLSEFTFTGFTVEDENSEDSSSDTSDDINSGDLENNDASGDPDEQEVFDMLSDFPQVDMKMAPFESLSFEFGGLYPANWYYAGTAISGSDVLRHYGFSDESVTDDNEIIGLDLISGSMPNGSVESYGDRQFTTISNAGEVTVYTKVGDKVFKVYGPSDYKDLVVSMAMSIDEIQEDAVVE